MAIDDPFFNAPQGQDDDRTVILRPNPGGAIPQNPPPTAPPVSFNPQPLPLLGRLNPLEQAASGLLALMTQISQAQNYQYVDQLRQQMIIEIQRFQNHALKAGLDQKTVYAARYVLCTTLDEAVLNTPWGSNSHWSQQNLLSTFHKEVSGGERFFHMLKNLSQAPNQNLYLLELMYICLALGFKGRYRIVQGGTEKLNQIRDWLYQIIRRERGEPERELSPHWRGIDNKKHFLLDWVPSWVIGSSIAALLGLVFFAFLIQLNQLSDPVAAELRSIEVKPLQTTLSPPPAHPLPAPVPTPPVLTLAKLLAPEIQQGKVKVEESPQQDKAIIQSDNLFRSGSDRINPKVLPLLERIGESLEQLPGQVLIVGHSDSIPIRSARFPSNWHLSKARAESVAKIIAAKLSDPSRIKTIGKADSEPVASNATPEGRAKNRRVEVILLK